MKSKTFSIHFNGTSIQTDVFSNQTIKCGEFQINTPKLSLTFAEADEDTFSDIDIPLEDLEALSKVLSQLVDNIKKDLYINER